MQYLYNIYKYIYISYISYYPEKRYWNACFIAGTRICSCTNIKEHLPKHIYKFGRHLRIRYYNQPTQTKEIQQETELQDNNNTSDIEEQLPLNLTYTQEIPTNNTQQDINSQQTSKDEQQIPDEEYHTSEEEQQTTHTPRRKEKQQEQQEDTPIPNIYETPEIIAENDKQLSITVRKKSKWKINTLNVNPYSGRQVHSGMAMMSVSIS